MIRRLSPLLLVLMQSGCVLFPTTSHTAQKPAEDVVLPAADSAQACLVVGETLARQGYVEQAINQFLKARTFDPQADVSPVLARLYARAGNAPLAMEEFTRALAAHPADPALWNDLGYFHYQQGNWARAEEHYRKVVELSPGYLRAWTNLGLALGQQQKYPEALLAFAKAARPAAARCNLAFVLATQGKRTQARTLYLEALQLDPGLQLAREALARLERSQAPSPTAAPQAAPSDLPSLPKVLHLPPPPIHSWLSSGSATDKVAEQEERTWRDHLGLPKE